MDYRFRGLYYFVSEWHMRLQSSSNAHPDLLLGRNLTGPQRKLLVLGYHKFFASSVVELTPWGVKGESCRALDFSVGQEISRMTFAANHGYLRLGSVETSKPFLTSSIHVEVESLMDRISNLVGQQHLDTPRFLKKSVRFIGEDMVYLPHCRKWRPS